MTPKIPMAWRLPAALLACLVVSLPAHAYEVTREGLAAIFPLPGADIRAMTVDVATDHEIHLARLEAVWPQGEMVATGVRIAPEGGRIRLTMHRAVFEPAGQEAISLSMSGSLLLDPPRRGGVPPAPGSGNEDAQALVCGFIQRLAEAQISTLSIAPREGPRSSVPRALNPIARASMATQVHLHDLHVAARPDALSCRFHGALSIGSARFGFGADEEVSAARISLQADLPLSVEAARTDTGRARIHLQASGVEHLVRGEVPAFGIGNLDLEAQTEAQRLQGLLLVLGRAFAASHPAEPRQLALESWNAVHVLRPELHLEADGLRLFMPAVIPTEMHANFRRAGLTNARGGLRLSIARSAGAAHGLSVDMQTNVIGVLSASLSAQSETRAIPASEIRQALAETGWTAAGLDLARLPSLRLTLEDTGVDQTVIDMFGIPAGRLAEELSTLQGASGRPIRAAFLQALSRSLRIAADGSPAIVTLMAPDAPLPSILLDPSPDDGQATGSRSTQFLQERLSILPGARQP